MMFLSGMHFYEAVDCQLLSESVSIAWLTLHAAPSVFSMPSSNRRYIGYLLEHLPPQGRQFKIVQRAFEAYAYST